VEGLECKIPSHSFKRAEKGSEPPRVRECLMVYGPTGTVWGGVLCLIVVFWGFLDGKWSLRLRDSEARYHDVGGPHNILARQGSGRVGELPGEGLLCPLAECVRG
jgi:hypothetical protein